MSNSLRRRVGKDRYWHPAPKAGGPTRTDTRTEEEGVVVGRSQLARLWHPREALPGRRDGLPKDISPRSDRGRANSSS